MSWSGLRFGDVGGRILEQEMGKMLMIDSLAGKYNNVLVKVVVWNPVPILGPRHARTRLSDWLSNNNFTCYESDRNKTPCCRLLIESHFSRVQSPEIPCPADPHYCIK